VTAHRPFRRPAAIGRARWRVGLALWGLTLTLLATLLATGPGRPALAGAAGDLAARLGALRDPDRAAASGLAPDFTLAGFDGGDFRLSAHRGEVVVVNVWASWCLPCRAEAPRFAAAAATYRARGVTFVGVDFQDRERDARAFSAEFGLRYANGPDPDGGITQAYGVSGLPATFVIDRQGRIARRWPGEITEGQLTAFIEEALR